MPHVGARDPPFAHAAFVTKPYWGATGPPDHEPVCGAARHRLVTVCEVCPNTQVLPLPCVSDVQQVPTCSLQEKTHAKEPGIPRLLVCSCYKCFTVSHYVTFLI
jgi:hypothetical protein